MVLSPSGDVSAGNVCNRNIHKTIRNSAKTACVDIAFCPWFQPYLRPWAAGYIVGYIWQTGDLP